MNTYNKWKEILIRTVTPIIEGFADKTIRDKFPKIHSPYQKIERYNDDKIFMELFCRTVLGINVLFNKTNIDNDIIIKNLFNKTIIGFSNVFNGYIDFINMDNQIMVEMALIAITFKRHNYLWDNIDIKTKEKILDTMVMTNNKFVPNFNNWLLFKCMIDIFLYKNNKINSLLSCYNYLKQFEAFYTGDGWYKDGIIFHMDYYNSYVIHPFLIDIFDELKNINKTFNEKYDKELVRMQRYCEYLERIISPDGTFPLLGRSMVYRTAVFHALSYCAFLDKLPDSLSKGQVRCALTAVIDNMFIKDNFDENNYLQYGFIGYQPEVADNYSNSGSLYYCLLIFIPLGLSNIHSFWTDKSCYWTQKKAWSGMKIIKDKILEK